MQGTFAQIALTDVLQLCILAKKSGLLRLTQGKEIVEIYFVKGDVIHATCPFNEGEKAFFYPLTWTEGSFVLQRDAPAPSKTVTTSSGELLSELMTVSQEWEEIREVIPNENSVFRVVEGNGQRSGPITISAEQWKILSRINGSRSVKSIAEAVRLPYFDTAKTIYGFHREGLIELIPGSVKAASEAAPKAAPEVVPQGFFDRMVHGLAEISGPIASVVVRDQVAALGGSVEAFPRSRLQDLIESVSQQISDKRLKVRFQQKMSEEARALKLP